MFKSIAPMSADTLISVYINGIKTPAKAGQTVVSVLLQNNHKYNRTTAVSGDMRSAYCLMGACFDCLVNIDGMANQQACLTTVTDGMRITYQQGKPDISNMGGTL